jgi:Na+/melibiose symporter-like transporter
MSRIYDLSEVDVRINQIEVGEPELVDGENELV